MADDREWSEEERTHIEGIVDAAYRIEAATVVLGTDEIADEGEGRLEHGCAVEDRAQAVGDMINHTARLRRVRRKMGVEK